MEVKQECNECKRLKKAIRVRTMIFGVCTFFLLICTSASYRVFVRSIPKTPNQSRPYATMVEGFDKKKIKLIAYGEHTRKNGRVECRFESVLWATDGIKPEYAKGDVIASAPTQSGGNEIYHGEGRILAYCTDLTWPDATWYVHGGKVMIDGNEVKVDQFLTSLGKTENANKGSLPSGRP